MINEELFKQIVAKNLTNYRKINNLTQQDIADKLCYSDKAISKWERGESLPDLYTLGKIAELYNITINDLCLEKTNVVKPITNKKTNHLFVTLLSSILVWFVAVLVFTILKIIPATENYPVWLSFIFALPSTFIVLTVFAVMWYGNIFRCIAVSGIVWGTVLALQLVFYISNVNNTSLLYVVGAIFQVLVITWFIMIITKQKQKAND